MCVPLLLLLCGAATTKVPFFSLVGFKEKDRRHVVEEEEEEEREETLGFGERDILGGKLCFSLSALSLSFRTRV